MGRYVWPFCDFQVFTHHVVVAPAPELTDKPTWFFDSVGLYFTAIEFADPGWVSPYHRTLCLYIVCILYMYMVSYLAK